MVEQLSTLAAIPEAVSRETAQTARQIWVELAETCRGHVALRDSYKRGAEAWAKIRDGYAAQKVGRQKVGPAPAGTANDELAAPDEATAFAGTARQKRRMIAALEQAAIAEDPVRFVEHVRLCEQAWSEMGSAGPEEPALSQAYAKAIAAYRRAVDARDAR